MRNLFVLLFFYSAIALGQSNFKKATVWFNDQTQQELMINENTIFEKIEYQSSNPSGRLERLDLAKVLKITFESGSEYIIKTVDIDLNRKDGENTSIRHPELDLFITKKQAVLSIVVKGSKTLAYTKVGEIYYFYIIENDIPEYLIYNVYVRSEGDFPGQMYENKMYKRQLFQKLECDGFDKKKIQPVKYRISDLSKLIKDFNKCDGSYVESQSDNINKMNFKYAIYAGLGMHSISLETSALRENPSSSLASPTFGAEVNLNIGTQDIFLRTTYTSFSTSYNTSLPPNTGVNSFYNQSEINASLLNLSLGYRKYFSVGTNTVFYLAGSFNYITSLSGQVVFKRVNENNEVLNSPPVTKNDFENEITFGLGTGFLFSNKFGVELNYMTKADLLKRNIEKSVNVSTINLLAFYRFDFAK